MLTLKRTNSSNTEFIRLVNLLDADLKIRDGDEQEFYNQFNSILSIKNCIVAYDNEVTVGCGGIKFFDESTMEIKRMYVIPEQRG